MIGVIVDSVEQNVVREFFELFKTPWEFFREDRDYDVLLCAGDYQVSTSANLVIVYAGRKIESDAARHFATGNHRKPSCVLAFEDRAFPVYGESISFVGREASLLSDADTHECIGFLDKSAERSFARIGFDLFKEVWKL